MKFSFELRDVRCNSVLSTDDSPWGAADGIRVYFLVATGSGARELRISGRELPPPDLVDNYVFTPGKTLDLRSYPPRNAPSWDTGPIELGDGDNAYIAVVGINEGLPYVAGGGGGGGSAIAMAAVEGFFSGVASGIAGPAGEAVVGAAFEALNRGLEGLNHDPECRGVAFAFNIVMTSRHVLSRTVATGGNKITLRDQTGDWGLAIQHGPRRSDCGHPDYEATLRFRLRDELSVGERRNASDMRQGLLQDFPAVFGSCLPDAAIVVWPMVRDWTIVLQPTFSWPILIWRIAETEIYDPSGSMRVPSLVEFPPARAKVSREVDFDYQVSEIGGVKRLTLKTSGDDGNYEIKVALLLKFADDQAPVVFWEQDVRIDGQLLAGNAAYYEYLACVDHLLGVFKDLALRYVIPVPRPNLWGPFWVEPEWSGIVLTAWPAQQILDFERDMLHLVKVLKTDFQMVEELGQLGPEGMTDR